MQLALEGPEADPAAAWRCIADPEPFLRAAGLPPIELQPAADEDGEVTLRAVLLGPVGLRHEAEELRAGWSQEERVWFAWKVRGPILSGVTFEAELSPPGPTGGRRPQVRLTIETWTAAVAPMVAWGLRVARRAWQRRLDALPLPGDRETPQDARHLDLSTEAALARWADRQGDPALVGRVRRLLLRSPAWRLDRLCPGSLAAAWDLPVERVLDGMVSAVSSGVLGVSWQVHCPRCDALVDRFPAISALPATLVCPWCRSGVPLDLCATVSAAITVPLLVRPHEERYAAHTPARDPDTWAMALVDGGRSAEVRGPPRPGHWRIVGGADADDAVLDVAEGHPETASWSPGTPTVPLAPSGRLILNGSPRRRHRVRIVRGARGPHAPAGHNKGQPPAPPNADPVAETGPLPGPGSPALLQDSRPTRSHRIPALRILTHPGWRRVLGRPGLAPRVVAEVAVITVMYSDLTNTGAFYRTVGDREALRFVQSHLAVVESRIEQGGGVVVKTLGDGVMAAFSSPALALGAAVGLLAEFDSWCRTHGVRSAPALRLGVAHGHALAMHTDAARLDLFGGTVNAAARAVYAAPSGTLQCTAELAEDPDWKAAVAHRAAGGLVRVLPAETTRTLGIAPQPGGSTPLPTQDDADPVRHPGSPASLSP